jgi:exodeoxyribonuclease X
MIVVIDLETTGLDPTTAAICELATVTMTDKGTITGTFSTLVKPPHPIPPIACGIHHITDDMVRNAPNITNALLMASKAVGPEKRIYYAAHNAAFDSAFLPDLQNGCSGPMASEPWLCTWRCAKHLWPEAPAHGNSVLRYWLPKLDEEICTASKNYGMSFGVGNEAGFEGPMNFPPHRALPDAWVTAHILKRMLKIKLLTELMELSYQPILLRTCYLGEHYGKPWSEVPPSFCQWLLSKGPRRPNTNGGRDIGFDDDTRHTALHYYSINQEKGK